LFSFVNFYFSIIFSGLWNNSFSSAAETLFYLVITEVAIDLSQYIKDKVSYSYYINMIAKDPYFKEGIMHVEAVENQIN
jgi:hypothetical protein